MFRPKSRLLLLPCLVSLVLGGPSAAQSPEPGINRNFVEPPVATKRQIEHNNFFLHSGAAEGEGDTLGTILDLQTSDYALAERPANLDYDVYSAIGFGLATSMMVVGPRVDAEGYRRVVIIDTLEDAGSAADLAQRYLALYNERYLDRPGEPSLAPKDKLPLDVVIYTHNHIDHTGGVLGYLSEADKEPCPAQNPDVRGLGGEYAARRNCVEIISQEKVVDAVTNTSSMSGRMIQARSFYMYGLTLKNELSPPPPVMSNPEYGEAITNGIGPYLSRGTAGFRLPSRTFAEAMWLEAAGVRMRLIYVPSETNDELAVFVPDAMNGADAEALPAASSGLLFSAEVVQGPAFPNLYSLRGTQYRSPANWYASVDVLREFDSWCMVPSHGPPVCGRNNIQLLLRNFRDAVQFTHDQTLRFLNMGYTPDDLVSLVEVPEELAQELAEKLVPWPNVGDPMRGHVHSEDYLLPFYGSVPQSVRETYFGYLGWYDGDPVNLSPTPPTEAAVKMSKLVESGKSLHQGAEEALKAGDYQWAAELATISVRANRDDMKARQIKSQAFRELGARALNPNWSDWYFTSAAELYTEDSKPGKTCFLPFLPVGLISPVTQTEVPIDAWVDSWTWRVRGQESRDETGDLVFGFWFEPTEQDFGAAGYLLTLRRGIAEVTEWKGTRADFLAEATAAVQMGEAELDALILDRAQCVTDRNTGQTGGCKTFVEALTDGKTRLIGGTWKEAEEFFSHFDDFPTCEPPVTLPRV